MWTRLEWLRTGSTKRLRAAEWRLLGHRWTLAEWWLAELSLLWLLGCGVAIHRHEVL